MSDYCSTCGGTREVRIFLPGLFGGRYPNIVTCPDCSAPPALPVAPARRPVIVITKIVRDARRLLTSGKK